jgi:hypothetical protein
MELKVKRAVGTQEYTEGVLFINGSPFCDTLELFNPKFTTTTSVNVIAEEKKKHKICIPYGIYNVIISYSTRFKKKLPLLCGVPGFSGIRIHQGNSSKDSSGCILVGIKSASGKLKDSTITLNKLINLMGNNPCTITIE